MDLDPLDLAWAAGFFDGEGSTLVHSDVSRPGYLRLEVAVPQSGPSGLPEVLTRFQAALGGLGYFTGPDDKMYFWKSRGRAEAIAAIALLWPELGPVKRDQANDAIKTVLYQYESASYVPRSGRHVKRILDVVSGAPACADRAAIERAWAAGFLDGEGCFGLNRAKVRRRGPAWYRLRVSADQHGVVGEPPHVLARLQRSLGLGRIDRHSDPDDYKWSAEGRAGMEHVLTITAPWLGEQKRLDGFAALEKFNAQIRLKGDQTHCVRGHEYTRVAMKGGRLRRICNRCARITARGLRAKRGIKPRRFKDVTRRYTQ
ncbi:MAG TPA: hypothetical protein VGQ86_01515 [Candidatus Limnocylindria bacterium]|nr:hypothetical protein [Candidatus Limnocylindria bacterium]